MAISVTEKYEEERQKRQQASKGLSQYLDRQQSASFTLEDPWIENETPVTRPVPDGGRCKIVVFGAGFAGILAAINCLEAGVASSPDEILLVDPAGGFGGTWYWNRYPGLMCDVESYTYLPYLEETCYVPKRRFASGEEIRHYINVLVTKWHLESRAMFQSAGKTLTWQKDHWVCEIVEKPKGLPQQIVTINADYVFLGSGAFTYPKLPNIAGLTSFQGQMLHTGRWDYSITGGSPANPALDKLGDKKVAIIGTGATAIQAVPELAKYAKELYVVQRTPSAVGSRGNRDTDPEEWKTKIANRKGWQSERLRNLQMYTEQGHDLPSESFVDDGFCSMPSIAGAFGGPSDSTPEDVADHLKSLHALDDERAEKVRTRTVEIVKDASTAEKLQAWYPGWCKRPTFHDEYLPAFNRPNVHLVDTDGQDLQALTPNGIRVNDQEYPVDVIVWSTGYGNPTTESLAGKADMSVRGSVGQDMEELNKAMDLKTLHGCMAHGFPNLFLMSLSQAGVGVNQVQRLNEQSIHNSHIIAMAEKRTKDSQRPVIEPTEAACDSWGDEMASAAHLTAGMLACTPGYFTLEGDAAHIPPEAMAKVARNGLYGQGYLKYARILEEWRSGDNLDGVNITAAA